MQYTFSNIKGQRKLETLQTGHGWVEKLTPRYQILHCAIPTIEFWQKIIRGVDRHIASNLLQANGKLGLVNTLIQERLSGPFVLPKIFSDDNLGISTGLSRMTAEMLCGIDRTDISGLVVTRNRATASYMFEQCQEIDSTDAFEQQFALADIDYDLVWSEDSLDHVTFHNTILQHSVYAQLNETDHYFRVRDENRCKFLSKYLDAEQKICLHVCCEEQTRNFIEFDPTRYSVTFEYKETRDWQFSYGMLLGMFKAQEPMPAPSLNLWVYNIQEPLKLDYALAWTDGEQGAYYTKNRKVALFDPTMVTRIEELANFVK